MEREWVGRERGWSKGMIIYKSQQQPQPPQKQQPQQNQPQNPSQPLQKRLVKKPRQSNGRMNLNPQFHHQAQHGHLEANPTIDSGIESLPPSYLDAQAGTNGVANNSNNNSQDSFWWKGKNI